MYLQPLQIKHEAAQARTRSQLYFLPTYDPLLYYKYKSSSVCFFRWAFVIYIYIYICKSFHIHCSSSFFIPLLSFDSIALLTLKSAVDVFGAAAFSDWNDSNATPCQGCLHPWRQTTSMAWRRCHSSRRKWQRQRHPWRTLKWEARCCWRREKQRGERRRWTTYTETYIYIYNITKAHM